MCSCLHSCFLEASPSGILGRTCSLEAGNKFSDLPEPQFPYLENWNEKCYLAEVSWRSHNTLCLLHFKQHVAHVSLTPWARQAPFGCKYDDHVFQFSLNGPSTAIHFYICVIMFPFIHKYSRFEINRLHDHYNSVCGSVVLIITHFRVHTALSSVEIPVVIQ